MPEHMKYNLDLDLYFSFCDYYCTKITQDKPKWQTVIYMAALMITATPLKLR